MENQAEQTKETEIVYPFEGAETHDDGSTTITKIASEGATSTWVRKFPDGKSITKGEDGLEVTRYPEGNLEFKFKNGVKVEIAVGDGDDVMRARRVLGGKSNEDLFLKSFMAELCRFDGKKMIAEDIGRKHKSSDFLTLMGYFTEVNF